MDNIDRKRCRRRKNLSESDEGVATTVGTIMALLVFLSLLSLITQQYVPIWMEDKEAYHVDNAMGQFSQIKGTIDTLAINRHKDYPMYSTVTLGAEGVPLFAARSTGVLRLLPDDGGMDLSFGGRSFSSSGLLSLEARNRYFEEQTIVYQNGAILLEQEEQSIIRAPPQLSIEEDGDGYTVNIHMIDIEGDETRIGGSRNIGVITELWSTTTVSYSDVEFDEDSLVINTDNPAGWREWIVEETDTDEDDWLIDQDDGELTFPNEDDVTITDLSIRYSTVNIEIST